jgi:hypothetical protein
MNRRHLIPASLVAGGLMTLTAAVGVVSQTGAAAGQPTGTTSTTITSSAVPAVEASTTGAAVSAAYQARNASAQRVHDARALQVLDQANRAVLFNALVEAHNGVQGPMWSCIRLAESGNRYGITSGAYGILISSWQAYSYVWEPYGSWSVPGEAPEVIQDLVAWSLYKVGGGFGGWNDFCTGR